MMMKASSSSFYSNPFTFSEGKPSEEVLIDDAMVFKAVMTRDYRGVTELALIQEGITRIDSGNQLLGQLGGLKKLDLSFNKIAKIDNLEVLGSLKELNLSFNRIDVIENLGKLPNLRLVNLSHNKIKRLENLKNLRKLEVLQIGSNLIEELTVLGNGSEPLIELKELHIGKNKIQMLKASLTMFPNLEEIDLSGNPLNYISNDALTNCVKLETLRLDNVQFRNPNSDLTFLASAPSLTRLSLNKSVNDMQTLDGFQEMVDLEDLSLVGNGIISLVGIEEKFPNLAVLDISHNKIFSVLNVDVLRSLPHLAEVNFQGNPICVHRDLKDQLQKAVPFLEVFNREQIMETGHKYREEIIKLKQQLLNAQHVGTYQGDRHIEEAENDPNIHLRGDDEDQKNSDGEEISQLAASYGQSKLSQLFNMMQKSQNRTDQAIIDFEKNFGLRLQKLTDNQLGLGLSTLDYQTAAKKELSSQNGGKPLDMDNPVVDAEIFELGIKRQFGDLKKNFRTVVDNLRTTDYEMFVKVNEQRAKQNQRDGAYEKLEDDLSKLKEQIDKANNAKALLSDLFGQISSTTPTNRNENQPDLIRNHTDARLRGAQDLAEESDEDFEDDEGRIDFDDLYHKSQHLHSRQGQRGPQQVTKVNNSQTYPDEESAFESNYKAKIRGPAKASLPKSLSSLNQQPNKRTTANHMREGKDFIIRQSLNSGTPSSSQQQASTTALGFNKDGPSLLTQQQRKLLGMSKPHMLAKQNELIQQMLNQKEAGGPSISLSETFDSVSGKRMKTQSSFNGGGIGSSTNKASKPVGTTVQDTQSDAKSSISQTSAKKKRASGISQTKSKFSDLFKVPDSFGKEIPQNTAKQQTTINSAVAKPLFGTAITMNPRILNKKAHSDDEDDNGLLSEKQLEKRERESYKHNFLTKYMEKFEEEEKRLSKTPRVTLPSKIPLAKAISDVRAMESEQASIQQPQQLATGTSKPKYKVAIQKVKQQPKGTA